MTVLFIAGLKGWQLIFVVLVIFLLFGGVKKIPDFMRSLGKGVHSFRQGLEDAKEEMNRPVEKRGGDNKDKEDDK
ncbi:MAG: twin-arginine translocase TatA/TatE family subunit [Muribaculaceae bacterium]